MQEPLPRRSCLPTLTSANKNLDNHVIMPFFYRPTRLKEVVIRDKYYS